MRLIACVCFSLDYLFGFCYRIFSGEGEIKCIHVFVYIYTLVTYMYIHFTSWMMMGGLPDAISNKKKKEHKKTQWKYKSIAEWKERDESKETKTKTEVFQHLKFKRKQEDH